MSKLDKDYFGGVNNFEKESEQDAAKERDPGSEQHLLTDVSSHLIDQRLVLYWEKLLIRSTSLALESLRMQTTP
jgi:hypothetical protein